MKKIITLAFAALITLTGNAQLKVDSLGCTRIGGSIPSTYYSTIQNYDSAIDDLSTLLEIDPGNVIALWQRAVCQARQNEFSASQGTNVDLKNANVLSDLTQAINLAPQNAYLYYNRGNLHMTRGDNRRAEDDFTRAIETDPNLAEAYYNRGLLYIRSERKAEGIADLSKAGELGLYSAYSVIKKYTR